MVHVYVPEVTVEGIVRNARAHGWPWQVIADGAGTRILAGYGVTYDDARQHSGAT